MSTDTRMSCGGGDGGGVVGWLMELVGMSLRFEVVVVWMWFWLSRKRIKEKLISGGLQVGVLTVVSANTNRTPRKMDGWLQV